MHPYSLKSSKGAPLLPRRTLVFLIAVFGLYVCYLSFNQIRLENEGGENSAEEHTEHVCMKPSVLSEELRYMHFPKPKGYNRELIEEKNLSSIVQTLDKLYNLDWLTSAAKYECTAAFGLKWMLNQGFMDHHDDIVSYFNQKGVSLIFLFRRNTLRRLISVSANNYDRDAKQLDGTHKFHVHSEEEAEILAKFKPELDVSTLISDIRDIEKYIRDCLDRFNTTRHMILFYEDIISNRNALFRVQEFLGVPARKLVSRQVKIHTRPLPDLVKNWEDVDSKLNGTEYAHFLDGADYVK